MLTGTLFCSLFPVYGVCGVVQKTGESMLSSKFNANLLKVIVVAYKFFSLFVMCNVFGAIYTDLRSSTNNLLANLREYRLGSRVEEYADFVSAF